MSAIDTYKTKCAELEAAQKWLSAFELGEVSAYVNGDATFSVEISRQAGERPYVVNDALAAGFEPHRKAIIQSALTWVESERQRLLDAARAEAQEFLNVAD